MGILGDLTKALAQMWDPRFRGVLLGALALTVLLLAGLTWAVQVMLPDSISLPFIGEIGFLTNVFSGFILIAMIVLSVFLMVPVASLFTGFFLDRIAEAVEAKHYPHLDRVPPVPVTDQVLDSLRFLVLIILVNLLALVVYLFSFVFAPLIFWALNGILLGREYFQLVAMRRVGRAEANVLRRMYRGEIWLAGFLMAIPLTVPVLNLLVPIVGAATFTHLYHRLTGAGIGEAPRQKVIQEDGGANIFEDMGR